MADQGLSELGATGPSQAAPQLVRLAYGRAKVTAQVEKDPVQRGRKAAAREQVLAPQGSCSAEPLLSFLNRSWLRGRRKLSGRGFRCERRWLN